MSVDSPGRILGIMGRGAVVALAPSGMTPNGNVEWQLAGRKPRLSGDGEQPGDSLSYRPFFERGVWGGAPNRLPTSEDGGQKESASLCEALGKKLRKRPANHSSNLSTTVHTSHMEPKKPERAVWIFLAVFLGVAWAAIVFLAVEVTNTVVAMLKYVVDLAQLY